MKTYQRYSPKGKQLDRNGYAPSLLQEDLTYCFLCGRRDRKLDRHEIFTNAYRKKSKATGMWVMLCHDDCHEGPNGVHRNPARAHELRQLGQMALMANGWTVEDVRRSFGRNYL